MNKAILHGDVGDSMNFLFLSWAILSFLIPLLCFYKKRGLIHSDEDDLKRLSKFENYTIADIAFDIFSPIIVYGLLATVWNVSIPEADVSIKGGVFIITVVLLLLIYGTKEWNSLKKTLEITEEKYGSTAVEKVYAERLPVMIGLLKGVNLFFLLSDYQWLMRHQFI